MTPIISDECKIIRKLIYDWDGFNSETFLQKVLFFLESLNWNKIQLDYKKYKQGPYSNNLRLDLTILRDCNQINIRKNGLNTIIKPNRSQDSQNSIKIKNRTFEDKLEYKVLKFFDSIGNLKDIGWVSSFHFIIIHRCDFNLRLIFSEFYLLA